MAIGGLYDQTRPASGSPATVGAKKSFRTLLKVRYKYD